MSSAFVTVAPKTRAPRSNRRRRKEKEAAKLAAASTTTTDAEPAPTDAPNGAVPTSTSTSGATSPPSETPHSVSPPKPVPSPSKPKPASIWDKRAAARQTTKPSATPSQPPPPSQSKPKPAPSSTATTGGSGVSGPGLSGGRTSRLGSGKGFSARRTANKYDPNAPLSSRTAAKPKEKVDASSMEQFPALSQKKKSRGGFGGVKREAVAYNPDEADQILAREKERKPIISDERPSYDARPSYQSRPVPGGLSSRSSGYRGSRSSGADAAPRGPRGGITSSSSSSVSISDLTPGRGRNKYIPPTLRTLTHEQKLKLSGKKPEPEPKPKATPKPITRPQATSPPQRPPQQSPTRPAPVQQRPPAQRPQPQRPQPPPQRPVANVPTQRVPDRARPPAQPTRRAEPTRPSPERSNVASPQRQGQGQRATGRQMEVSPAKSTMSNKSGSSSQSSSGSAKKIKKKTKITPVHLSGDATKKYLELRRGGIGSIRDTFLMNNDDKKLHDVASVKKKLASSVAENDDSSSIPYYYDHQDMVDYVVNSDFNALNDKSVSAGTAKIKSTADAWNPQFPTVGAPAAAPAAVNPYAPTTVYAQDGLPATAPMVNPINPVAPGPPPGPNVNAVANAWNPATGFNPMAAAPAPNAYDTSPTPNSPRNPNVLADPNARGPLSLQQPQSMVNAPMNAMVPTHAPGQVMGAVAMNEPFPGMIPNVPLVTDPNEIQKNAQIAGSSALSPTVPDFQPTPNSMGPPLGGVQPQALNQQFQFGANQIGAAAPYGAQQMMNQFAAQNFLGYNASANLQNQQWINQQQHAQPQQPPPHQHQQQQQPPPPPQHVQGVQPQGPSHPLGQQHTVNMNGAGPDPRGQGHPQGPPHGLNLNSNAMNPQMNGNGMGSDNVGGFQPHNQHPAAHHNHSHNHNHSQHTAHNQHSQHHPPPQQMAAGSGGHQQHQQGPQRGGYQHHGNAMNQGHRGRGGGGGGGYQGQQRGGRGGGNGGYNRSRNFRDDQGRGGYTRGRRGGYQGDRGYVDRRDSDRRGGYRRGGGRGQYVPRNRNSNDGGGGNNNSGGNSNSGGGRQYQSYRERRGGGRQWQRGQYQSQNARRREQKKLMENQNALYKENVFGRQDEVKYDATTLPRWVGDGAIDRYFGPSEQDNGLDEHYALSKCYDEGLCVRFLCSAASDGVYECLGFKEVVQTLVPAASKLLYARIRDTAPVFGRLTLCDWLLDLGGGFVKHIGDQTVLSSKGLFGYKNPRGLRSVSIKYSRSLSEWLATVPWEPLRLYLEQNSQCLESVILGDGTDPTERKRESAKLVSSGGGGAGGDVESASRSLPAVDAEAVGPMKRLFSSFVTASQFVAESAPFAIDVRFITNLTRMVRDLRLFDERLKIGTNDLRTIQGHFGSLQRLGVPAGRVAVLDLVTAMENHVDELMLRNLDNKTRLSAQDLALLFERFESVEVDSSLVVEYPTLKSKAKIAALSLRADTHNFFIPLLLGVPPSVRTLTIKNATFSSNNLIIDLAQKAKFRTANVNTLVLEGFADNLKQIWKVLQCDFFPNLRRLQIHFLPSDRAYKDHRSTEEQIRRHQADNKRLHKLQIDTVFRHSKY